MALSPLEVGLLHTTFFHPNHVFLGRVYKLSTFQNWLDKWKNYLDERGITRQKAISLMEKTNPSVIPRNHIVEEALRLANQNDWTAVESLWNMIRSPYTDRSQGSRYHFPPDGGDGNYRTFCGT